MANFYSGALSPTSVMVGNDPPSPCLTAVFCLPEVPRQVRDEKRSIGGFWYSVIMTNVG
ncbi:hypothetical protein [Parabacteroides pacaensis]|uniref:hypothetical protein n=1 Tax=Parabacteroides pacaensis TaxID=2086575 RepID=UPI00131DBEC0|nr:hypothetical protein [Parabacteroides pacaensis]